MDHSTIPIWALALAFWVHLIATVIWVGGLALMALVVWPGAQAALGSGPQLATLIRAIQQRFAPLTWLSLAALTVTGLIQMSGNVNYDGFLQITNLWAVAILIKHVAVGGMMLVGAYLHWGVQPTLARLTTLAEHGHPAPGLEVLRHRELALTRLNLLGGMIVLALTAVARAL